MTDNRINFKNIFPNNQLMTSENFIIEDNKLIFKAIIFPFTKISDRLILESDISFEFINNQVYTGGWKKIIFDDCKFETLDFIFAKYNFEFKKCEIYQLNFKDIESSYSYKFIATDIKHIKIDGCNFKERFYINPQYEEYLIDIDNVVIQDTEFYHNFRFHNSNVQNFKINNTNFDKNADFFKSKFLQKNDLIFKGINFRGITIFEQCLFASKLCMEYVTFTGMTHFREATFESGLDLDKSNIEKEMNFYNAKELDNKISKLNTTQETYRIIKSNFAKIGNQIEANRFHGFELEKRAYFLNERWKSHFFEWFVFKIHWLSSKFATNWVLPLFWIVCMGALTNEYLNYSVYQPFNFDYEFSLDLFFDYWNKTAHYMSIVSDDDPLKETPWLFLVNKVGLGYLYYQFVSAIRKDTKQS